MKYGFYLTMSLVGSFVLGCYTVDPNPIEPYRWVFTIIFIIYFLVGVKVTR